MKFAAGLTLTGIIGFIITEALKLLVPTVTVWVMGLLAFALKVLLIGFALVAAAAVIGLGFFLYKRAQKAEAEA